MQAKALDREVFIEPPEDVNIEDKMWRLRKTFYGFNEASRKFWLKIKEVFSESQKERLKGDEAYYYPHDKDGNLEGIISCHVDDFILAGRSEFMKEITDKIKEKFDNHKLEDDLFRFTSIDVKKEGDKILISMNKYARSLNKMEIRK